MAPDSTGTCEQHPSLPRHRTDHCVGVARPRAGRLAQQQVERECLRERCASARECVVTNTLRCFPEPSKCCEVSKLCIHPRPAKPFLAMLDSFKPNNIFPSPLL